MTITNDSATAQGLITIVGLLIICGTFLAHEVVTGKSLFPRRQSVDREE